LANELTMLPRFNSNQISFLHKQPPTQLAHITYFSIQINIAHNTQNKYYAKHEKSKAFSPAFYNCIILYFSGLP